MDCIGIRNRYHLHLDHELARPEAAAFESHLRDCAACRADFGQVCDLSDALRSDLTRHVAPAQLRDRIRADVGLPQRRRALADLRLLFVGRNPAAIAASVMLAIVASSAVTTSYLRPSTEDREDRIVQDVISGHIRSLMAGHLTDVASSDGRVVEPWFVGKLDVPPPAVDLAASGYPLVGGRIDYIDDRPAAALVYRHDSHVINVFICPRQASDGEGPESFEKRGYNVAYFAEGHMDFWLVSDLDRGELERFGNKLNAATRRAL